MFVLELGRTSSMSRLKAEDYVRGSHMCLCVVKGRGEVGGCVSGVEGGGIQRLWDSFRKKVRCGACGGNAPGRMWIHWSSAMVVMRQGQKHPRCCVMVHNTVTFTVCCGAFRAQFSLFLSFFPSSTPAFRSVHRVTKIRSAFIDNSNHTKRVRRACV